MNEEINEDVAVRLGERVWTMRPTPGAMAAIERHTGKDFDEVAREVWENRCWVDTMAAVPRAGIAAAHDDAPDFDAVGEMMFKQGMVNLLRPVLVFIALVQAREHAAATRAMLDLAVAQASAK